MPVVVCCQNLQTNSALDGNRFRLSIMVSSVHTIPLQGYRIPHSLPAPRRVWLCEKLPKLVHVCSHPLSLVDDVMIILSRRYNYFLEHITPNYGINCGGDLERHHPYLSLQFSCFNDISTLYTHTHTHTHTFLSTLAAMTILVEIVRQEAGGASTQTTELQIGNFIGQVLTELGLYRWLSGHGGWVSQCCAAVVCVLGRWQTSLQSIFCGFTSHIKI